MEIFLLLWSVVATLLSIIRPTSGGQSKCLTYEEVSLSIGPNIFYNFEATESQNLFDSIKGVEAFKEGQLVFAESPVANSGNALYMDGVFGHLVIQSTSSRVSLLPASFSITFWSQPLFPPTQQHNQDMPIFSNVQENGGISIACTIHREWAFQLGNGEFSSMIYGGLCIPDHLSFVVASYDATTEVATLYVDGAFEASQRVELQSDPSLHLLIGAGFLDNGKMAFFDGLIDEFAIYSQALQDNDVQRLYYSGFCKEQAQPGNYLQVDFEDFSNSSSDCFEYVARGLSPKILFNFQQIDPIIYDAIEHIPGKLEGNFSLVSSPVPGSGQAFFFNGIDADVYIEPTAYFNFFTTRSFTIVFWAKPMLENVDQTLANIPVVSNKENALGISIWCTTTYEWVFFVGSGITQNEFRGGECSSGTLSLVVAAFDDNTQVASLYVNGEMVSSGNVAGSYSAADAPLYFGSGIEPDGSRGYFEGIIDGITVFPLPLSPADIRALRISVNCQGPYFQPTPQPTPDMLPSTDHTQIPFATVVPTSSSGPSLQPTPQPTPQMFPSSDTQSQSRTVVPTLSSGPTSQPTPQPTAELLPSSADSHSSSQQGTVVPTAAPTIQPTPQPTTDMFPSSDSESRSHHKSHTHPKAVPALSPGPTLQPTPQPTPEMFPSSDSDSKRHRHHHTSAPSRSPGPTLQPTPQPTPEMLPSSDSDSKSHRHHHTPAPSWSPGPSLQPTPQPTPAMFPSSDSDSKSHRHHHTPAPSSPAPTTPAATLPPAPAEPISGNFVNPETMNFLFLQDAYKKGHEIYLNSPIVGSEGEAILNKKWVHEVGIPTTSVTLHFEILIGSKNPAEVCAGSEMVWSYGADNHCMRSRAEFGNEKTCRGVDIGFIIGSSKAGVHIMKDGIWEKRSGTQLLFNTWTKVQINLGFNGTHHFLNIAMDGEDCFEDVVIFTHEDLRNYDELGKMGFLGSTGFIESEKKHSTQEVAECSPAEFAVRNVLFRNLTEKFHAHQPTNTFESAASPPPTNAPTNADKKSLTTKNQEVKAGKFSPKSTGSTLLESLEVVRHQMPVFSINDQLPLVLLMSIFPTGYAGYLVMKHFFVFHQRQLYLPLAGTA